MRLDELNALSAAEAERELLRCCGSARWTRMMAAARPFASSDAMAVTADVIWAALGADDWREAFAAHPRIGAAAAGPWASAEQAGVGDGSRERFAQANRDYEARFGHIFIVCATGKSGDEMLALLERRMRNNPAEELREAADQQRAITRLRLTKLLT
jgi:OHCU decarboxylase